MPQTTEAVLTIEVFCDECHRKRGETPSVFLQMEPKIGTKEPFFLCVRCWLSSHDGFDGPEARRDGRVLVDDSETAEGTTGDHPKTRRGSRSSTGGPRHVPGQ